MKNLMQSHCKQCGLWFDNKSENTDRLCSKCKQPLDHYVNAVLISGYIDKERERCRRVVADNSIKIRKAVQEAYLDAPMVVGPMLTQMQKEIYSPKGRL